MARFSGIIGFVETVETEPGMYKEVATEKKYYGEITKNYSNRESNSENNDNVTLSDTISIVADPYASQNFMYMQYVKFKYPRLGGVWNISSASVESYPRITLSLGGVYNGEQA